MFCPNCGKPDQSPETYCRQCGTFLNDFSKKKKQFSFGGETPQEQVRTNLFLNSISAIVNFICVIILYTTFWKRGGEFPIIYAVTGWLLAVGIWQFSTFLVGLKLRKTLKRGRNGEKQIETEKYQTAPLPEIRQADTTKILPEADFEDSIPASVTENTTKTLNKISRQ